MKAKKGMQTRICTVHISTQIIYLRNQPYSHHCVIFRKMPHQKRHLMAWLVWERVTQTQQTPCAIRRQQLARSEAIAWRKKKKVSRYLLLIKTNTVTHTSRRWVNFWVITFWNGVQCLGGQTIIMSQCLRVNTITGLPPAWSVLRGWERCSAVSTAKLLERESHGWTLETGPSKKTAFFFNAPLGSTQNKTRDGHLILSSLVFMNTAQFKGIL